MKFFALIYALAAVAIAAPSPDASPDGSPDESLLGCKPGTYACLPNGRGWQVCNTRGVFVFAGNCPRKTVCVFDNRNGSPYCVPPGFQIP